MRTTSNKTILFLVLLVLTSSCKEEIEPEEKEILNHFEMELDDTQWTPTVVNSDSCYSTFYCDYAGFGEGDQTYIIDAEQYPDDDIHAEDKDFLRLQIAYVTGAGRYYIADPQGEIVNSCALLARTRNGEPTIYQNKVDDHRNMVLIEEMIPAYNLMSIDGIRGSFSGVLFNIENPNDSVVIENGSFTFEYMVGTNYYRCTY